MTNPQLIATPFAENGTKNEIPETIGAAPQNATMSDGFPAITQVPIAQNGIPPERADFNGILNLYGQHISHLNKGLGYEFDSAFATKIGGYPLGAKLRLPDGTEVTSTTDNNTNNPEISMNGWVKLQDGISSVGSIGDLIDINNPKDGQAIIVHSFYLGLGKGGGLFIYDSSKSTKNDGGLVIAGWVRQWETYIKPEYFGAKGDAITDDYESLKKCFNALTPLSDTIFDANFQQYRANSGTVMLDSVVYRHTKPLRLPAMMDVISSGVISYFLDPSIVVNNNRPCFYYDGADLEVSAVYLPLYINNNDGTWSLNEDSTYIANAGDAAERSMSVGTNLRFNVITRRNTKIGVNLFGFESGNAELGVGTMGTWSSDQSAASLMQSQDYNYDDLSPRCGVYLRRAWNSRLTRPRIIAHKTGLYLGRHAAGAFIEQPYINRQLDKHTDAMGLQSEFLPEGIPSSKDVTCGIVMDQFDGALDNPITEHWGLPYMVSKSVVTLNKPHIEGSNLIMNHNFVIYQCAVTVNGWSGIRSMYERDGTSIVYSNGMSLAFGNFFDLKGAGYYSDNSGFIIVDSNGYDELYNGAFLSIENIPHDKLIGIVSFSDSRHIKKLGFTSNHKYQLYLDSSRLGQKKGFGVAPSVALQSLSDVDEATRLLGDNWTGDIQLLSNITITQDQGLNRDMKLGIDLNGKTIHAAGGSFLLNGNISILFLGAGKLQATNTNMFKNTAYGKRETQIQTLDGVVFETSNYIFLLEASPFVDFSLDIHNSNLSQAIGKYANLNGAFGLVSIFVKSSTRNTAYDSDPTSNSENCIISSKLSN